MSSVSSCRRLAIAVAATVAALACVAAPAQAAVPGGCPAVPTSNPFAPWGDNADYELAPGGDFEDGGASWSLTGGAASQEGNETFMVGGPDDRLSLRLPPSSTATSARMCVGVAHPWFRFFVKRRGGSSLSRLAVDVVVDVDGRERSLQVGAVSGSGVWAPSARVPTVVNLLAPLADGAIDVAFRFRARGDAVWSIDDLYVDPYRMH